MLGTEEGTTALWDMETKEELLWLVDVEMSLVGATMWDILGKATSRECWKKGCEALCVDWEKEEKFGGIWRAYAVTGEIGLITKMGMLLFALEKLSLSFVIKGLCDKVKGKTISLNKT